MAEYVQVFLLALLTAVATGLGALPFLFFKDPTRRWLGVSNALAAGLMLAASFGLVYEGVVHGLWRTVLGMLLGLLFIVLTRRAIQQDEHPAVFASMGELDARKALLVVGVMTLHSFTEGVAIGVSFGGGDDLDGLLRARPRRPGGDLARHRRRRRGALRSCDGGVPVPDPLRAPKE